MTHSIDARTVFGTDYDLTHVGYAVDFFGRRIPVFESINGYHADLGGAVGLTDPIEAESLDEALRIFEDALN